MKPTSAINPWKKFVGCMLPNWLACRREVSLGAKLVYARLGQFAGKEGNCFPKQESLAKEVGLGVSQVRSYLAELRRHKLVTDERRGLGRGNLYWFLDHPWMHVANDSPIAKSTAQAEEGVALTQSWGRICDFSGLDNRDKGDLLSVMLAPGAKEPPLNCGPEYRLRWMTDGEVVEWHHLCEMQKKIETRMVELRKKKDRRSTREWLFLDCMKGLMDGRTESLSMIFFCESNILSLRSLPWNPIVYKDKAMKAYKNRTFGLCKKLRRKNGDLELTLQEFDFYLQVVANTAQCTA
jgi:hypothetical protein